jgi:2-methylthioadenine synthetase
MDVLFCSIPLMRGLQKSRTIPDLISETNRLVDKWNKRINDNSSRYNIFMAGI